MCRWSSQHLHRLFHLWRTTCKSDDGEASGGIASPTYWNFILSSPGMAKQAPSLCRMSVLLRPVSDK